MRGGCRKSSSHMDGGEEGKKGEGGSDTDSDMPTARPLDRQSCSRRRFGVVV